MGNGSSHRYKATTHDREPLLDRNPVEPNTKQQVEIKTVSQNATLTQTPCMLWAFHVCQCQRFHALQENDSMCTCGHTKSEHEMYDVAEESEHEMFEPVQESEYLSTNASVSDRNPQDFSKFPRESDRIAERFSKNASVSDENPMGISTEKMYADDEFFHELEKQCITFLEALMEQDEKTNLCDLIPTWCPRFSPIRPIRRYRDDDVGRKLRRDWFEVFCWNVLRMAVDSKTLHLSMFTVHQLVHHILAHETTPITRASSWDHIVGAYGHVYRQKLADQNKYG